jgi:hypothetical protein
MNLIDARPKLAALLAPIDDSDPDVLMSLSDSIEPPALMLGWGEPWLDPDTACFKVGHMLVTAVASRLMPGDGVAKLEELVDYTLTRIDPVEWALESVSGPRVFVIGKTSYLAVRIALRVLIDG